MATTLNFPNPSRSYDARRKVVRFWGHDGAMEVAFFLHLAAPDQLAGAAGGPAEDDGLRAFDAARDQVHAMARKHYARDRKAVYDLSMADI